MRTQLAVSVTRAATFSSRSLIVVNGLGEGMCLGNGVAHGEGQPIGGGVQESRIWLAVAARQLVRSEVQLDQVLGLAAGAIKVGIKPFGRPTRDVGDDVANVETEPRRLDAGCDAALPCPGLSRVGGLGEATHGFLVFDCALDADRRRTRRSSSREPSCR